MWHKYINGNHYVFINDKNGTKIRKTIDDNATEFISDFADSIDFKITNKCFRGCQFCHEKSTPDGLSGNMNDWKFIETLHPYTEVAIGGGDVLTFDKLYDLLELLKSKHIYANITISQNNIYNNKIDYIIKNNLVKGIGVSLYGYNKEDIIRIKSLPNTVIHLINGVTACEDSFKQLSNEGLKLLILGYKTFGRGIEYINFNNDAIHNNMEWVKNNIEDYITNFKVVSFDNLAVKQLKLKDKLTEEQWNMFYGGDDGTHTFYIDGVNKQFAISSVSEERFPLLNNIDDMFHFLQQKK